MSSTREQLFCVWILAFLHVVTSQKSANYCFSPQGKNGTCVPIKNCPKLFALLNHQIKSQADLQFLKSNLCPGMPVMTVCCEVPDLPSSTTNPPVEPVTSKETLMTLPTNKVCGKANAGQRIIGAPTAIDEFRWTVALDYNMTERKGVMCGGSLINTRYIITAAHCVNDVKDPRQITARLAEWDLLTNPDEDDGIKVAVQLEKIDRIRIHPEYKGKQNDIALLRMESTLPENYTPFILPICLPTSEELRSRTFADKTVSVAGWGANMTSAAAGSQYKMKADLKSISVEDCMDDYTRSLAAIRFSHNHICAKSLNSTPMGACKGDSGGPLQLDLGGDYYLIGVISTGAPCGKTLLPGVFTRITPYIDWIQQNLFG